jgi:hypothetical protein
VIDCFPPIQLGAFWYAAIASGKGNRHCSANIALAESLGSVEIAALKIERDCTIIVSAFDEVF